MLMTKYIFTVFQEENGKLHTVVTRIEDGYQKYFFQAQGSKEGMTNFMNSMTDELAESYFPKFSTKGKSPADNWLFIGENPGRTVAEELARVDLTAKRLS